jgi:hypothetical protein
MTDFVDFKLVLSDLKTAVTSASLGFHAVKVDANAADFTYQNMPLLDLRLRSFDPQPVTNTAYYADLVVEFEIAAYSLASREEAAKMRNQLLNSFLRYAKDHPRFSAAIDTTIVGGCDFGTGEDTEAKTGAFLAGVVGQIHVKLYTME